MANWTVNENLYKVRLCTEALAQGMLENITFSVLNILLSIAAVLGNALILVALQKESSLHSPSKLLFRCLASTDLCVGLIPQPFYVVHLLALAKKHWNLCYLGFVVTSVSGTVFSGVSLITLTAISIDRLLALLLRLRYRQVVTLKRVRILVAFCWLSCFAIGSSLALNSAVVARVVSVMLILCIVTSSFCYLKMYHTLRRHQTQVHDHVQQGQPNEGGSTLNMARYRKTVSTALWLQMTLLVCYLPYYITIAVAGTFIGLKKELPLATNIAFKLTITPVFLNSSLNPILYCWKLREVRQAVKNTIRQLFSFS
ncbi:adenosine receptor A3-like [Oculina patagonica]